MKSLTTKLILLLLLIKESNSNEITITIRGSGDQKLLSDEYQNQLPNEIILYGNTQDFENKIINLNQDINNITLKWNENILTNCSAMFKDLINIIEFDFSQFDCSGIIDMSYMFYNCSK